MNGLSLFYILHFTYKIIINFLHIALSHIVLSHFTIDSQDQKVERLAVNFKVYIWSQIAQSSYARTVAHISAKTAPNAPTTTRWETLGLLYKHYFNFKSLLWIVHVKADHHRSPGSPNRQPQEHPTQPPRLHRTTPMALKPPCIHSLSQTPNSNSNCITPFLYNFHSAQPCCWIESTSHFLFFVQKKEELLRTVTTGSLTRSGFLMGGRLKRLLETMLPHGLQDIVSFILLKASRSLTTVLVLSCVGLFTAL